MKRTRWFTYTIVGLMVMFGLILSTGFSVMAKSDKGGDGNGLWVAGDFHTHTFLTDGNKTEAEVVSNAFNNFGLDWMANSEHGGTSARDPLGNNFPTPVWRWITLSYYSFPIVQDLRTQYPDKRIIQGLEWNVPTHEHASVGIVANEPVAVSNFEYMFDASDKDLVSRPDLTKTNKTHADAVAGAAWLEKNFQTTSYFLLNHPSRKLLYTVSDIRDFNNAAPDVAFGLEGLPGHQKEPFRGGYGNNYGDKTALARTYGGADYMLANVGGLMDSLWGEGRHFWVFVNSDFHDNADSADFWPGEYAKSYTYVAGKNGEGEKESENSKGSFSYQAIVDGMRSGNSFAVHGDLINTLDFSVSAKENKAVMGQTLTINKGQDIKIKIGFKSPATNYCGAAPVVDHIDLIGGDVTGMTQPGTDAYKQDTNPTTKVIKTFTAADWKKEDGMYTVTFQIKKADKNQYFRLRGTNLGLNVPGETLNGNPLVDTLTTGDNNAAKACGDLWFYSNPIFVTVQ